MESAINRVTMKMVSMSDECALRTKVLETHGYDGVTFDTESLLFLIEGILNLVTPEIDGTLNGQTNQLEKHSIPDKLSFLLHKICCELNCKCLGGDSSPRAMEILKLLANYTWEAKIVIVLASFVVKNDQFSLVTKLDKSNPLISNVKKSKLETIISLVKASIEVTRFIAKFSSLPSKYISNDAEPMVVALNQIPIAVYWMTRVVVVCASHVTEILGQSEIINSYAETWDLPSFEKKISSIKNTFIAKLDLCFKYIDEKKETEYVEKLKLIFDKTAVHVDNQQILQLIISTKDGSLPLASGPDKTRKIGVEALKGKTVLLFISDLDISSEIFLLKKIYLESREKAELQYEIVWLPIVRKIEQDEEFKQKFEDLKLKMPWYTLQRPSLLEPAVVRYVKEEWHYSKKPIVVALDPQGKVASPNAFRMVWIWGNAAYPFTQSHELDIWNCQEWSLKLLVDGIDQTFTKWIQEDKVICLYGGEDYEWIQEFVTRARQVANAAGIQIEMVYMGKNTSKEHIKKLTEILAGRSLCWEDPTFTCYFWKRIKSMMHSKIHHGAKVGAVKETGDHILVEVLNMLMLGGSDQGWALISQGAGLGPGKIARAKGDVILKALVEFKTWSTEVKHGGFVTALHGYLAGRRSKEHCSRLILLEVDDIREVVVCTECHRPMKKYHVALID